MSPTTQVLLVIFASLTFSLLLAILGQLKVIVTELQRLRNVLAYLLGTDEEHRMAWTSWPHMIARLLEAIQGDVRDFRRKMIGREPYE